MVSSPSVCTICVCVWAHMCCSQVYFYLHVRAFSDTVVCEGQLRLWFHNSFLERGHVSFSLDACEAKGCPGKVKDSYSHLRRPQVSTHPVRGVPALLCNCTQSNTERSPLFQHSFKPVIETNEDTDCNLLFWPKEIRNVWKMSCIKRL